MESPSAFQGVAFNPAERSENEIHSDAVARRHGFRGGLVPGVTVFAYLVEPALRAWGRAFLERGTADVRLEKPVYEGEPYRVEVDTRRGTTGAGAGESAANGAAPQPPVEPGSRHVAAVYGPEEDTPACARGNVALASLPLAGAPVFRGDPPAPPREARPQASRAVLEGMRSGPLGSIETQWDAKHELARTARDEREMHPLVRTSGEGLANPSFTLGLANFALSNNVRLGPWIHVESRVQYFSAVPRGTVLTTEARILELFDRRGNEFVDLDVAVFAGPERPVMTAWHRAIYQLRER